MSTSEKKPVNRVLYDTYNKLIDELYESRDKYYILNPNSNNEDRIKALNRKLEELVSQIDRVRDEFNSISSYLVLVGRAHNVIPEYSQKSFDALSKAVKLDPKCYDAWNYLGECYWKQRDFESSRNCFLKSLSIEKNKLSLRGLSMINRQLAIIPPSTPPSISATPLANSESAAAITPKSLIEDSVKYAKEALQLDIKDGLSWYILANSYLAQFFSPSGQQKPDLLKQAIKAYQLALKEDAASLQSDLYYNKSIASLYEEDWKDVLFCLDKTLQLDPNWNEVYETLKGVLDYLTQIQDSITNNGKLKAKKFQSLVSSISDSDAGPYLNKFKVDENGVNDERRAFNLNFVCLKDLKTGLNSNKVVIGTVISGMPIKTFDMVCFSCCIADKNGDCALLTIYNLIKGEGVIIGDKVAIPEPWFENIEFQFQPSDPVRMNNSDIHEKYNSKFNSVRVENPSVLVVNGKKWTKDKFSTAKFVPTVLDD